MRMFSLSLVLVATACVSAFGGQPGELQGTGVVAQPAKLQTADVAVHKLGGVELPYAGEGEIEYDREENLWIIAFAAPEGWQCTHVGWSFPAGDNVSDKLRESGATLRTEDGEAPVWLVSGVLEVDVADGVLSVSVSTEEKTFVLEFTYDPGIADPDLTLTQSEGTGVLKVVVDKLGAPDVLGASDIVAVQDTEPTCSGGSCSCTGKCDACCSTGFHPYCRCSGRGSCRCLKNKVAITKLELQGLQVSG